jgi:hypothetical protein
MPDNPNDWLFEVVVHSNDCFEAFARESGYDDDTINSLTDPLRFQSINVQLDGVTQLHVPRWRWEVDKDELEKYRVRFL